MSKLPLNIQQVLFDYTGVNIGLWGQGRYVKTLKFIGACTKPDCEYTDEHLTFDGQFFFRRKK